jgi:hypothetical protein
LRGDITDDTEFLSLVDGKSSVEIVILGKQSFNKRKESGFKAYEKYEDWEQMITELAQDRVIKRNKDSISYKTDRKNNVLYTV